MITTLSSEELHHVKTAMLAEQRERAVLGEQREKAVLGEQVQRLGNAYLGNEGAHINYIHHLNSFWKCVANDTRLRPNHISLYMTLFITWNAYRFRHRFPIKREQVMRSCKIGSANTYTHCLKWLHKCGYIIYYPSGRPYIPCTVSMVGFAEEGGRKGGLAVGDMGGDVGSDMGGEGVIHAVVGVDRRGVDVHRDGESDMCGGGSNMRVSGESDMRRGGGREIRADIGSDIHTDGGGDMHRGVGIDMPASAETDIRAGTKTDTHTGTKTDTGTDLRTDTHTGIETDTGTDLRTDTHTGIETDTGTVAELRHNYLNKQIIFKTGGKQAPAKRNDLFISKKEKPTIEVVLEWFAQREVTSKEARRFFYHYEAISWTLSGQPIMDWEAAAAKWSENIKPNKNGKSGKSHTNVTRSYSDPL